VIIGIRPKRRELEAGEYGGGAAQAALSHISMLIHKSQRPVQAQTFRVIHGFTGGGGGTKPNGSLSTDTAGNIDGTTSLGGAFGNGNVFEMSQRNASGYWFRSMDFVFPEMDISLAVE
jgi:hypothetical protein